MTPFMVRARTKAFIFKPKCKIFVCVFGLLLAREHAHSLVYKEKQYIKHTAHKWQFVSLLTINFNE